MKLLKLPDHFKNWDVFEGHPADDNGGDPDGDGAIMFPASDVSQGEIEAAMEKGAKVVDGCEYTYSRDEEDRWQQLPPGATGYQSRGLFYIEM